MRDAVYQSCCLRPRGEEPLQYRAPEDAVSRQEWEAALVALRGQGGPSLCQGVTGLYGTAGGSVNLGRCFWGRWELCTCPVITWVTVWLWGHIRRDLVQRGPYFNTLRASDLLKYAGIIQK